ncbi:hypothetical protein PC117_g9064 [Phytophthora cactorum]|uniref:Uncharacterized protein n=2 Tax=Phytophthora cactorum TaxID=29920 RepID=A0A8T1DSD2_9STRA|nr:hypothetical protein PC117_g9064 [Phytophthora cactorum]
MSVLIPGIGRCQVEWHKLEFHQEESTEAGSDLMALTLDLSSNVDGTLDFDRLIPFLQAVGPPLKALTLQGFDKPFRDIIDLNAVIRSCPNLQEPTLTRDLVDVQLDFSEYRASNTTIPELRFEWLNIADFTGALWGRNSPLDKEVRKIGVLEGAAYKAVVTGSKAEAWNALKHMGRPKWLSNFTDLATEYGLPQTSADDVVHLAANKLLLGISSLVNTYNETVMFGVASMLCRLGVRPRPTSTLASHAVANFMAILAYVGYEKDDYLSSYASDPVLALGAIKVWYTRKDGLAKYILPQLKRLILDEVLDTGGIGEMVARILLLLAMDKCVIGDKLFYLCVLRGQYVSVETFLEILGADILQRNGPCRQLRLEPNEDTLWYLLGRRAAGTFPRDQREVDLLIPMFWKRSINGSEMETDEKTKEIGDKESMILIRVKNRYPKDSDFSMSKLRPRVIFEDEATSDTNSDANPLSKRANNEIIRVYMNLQEVRQRSEQGNDFFNFIHCISFKDESSPTMDSGPNASGEASKMEYSTYPFLDEDVAKCLASIVESEWNPQALLDGDLEYRRSLEKGSEGDTSVVLSEVMSDDELKETTSLGFAYPSGYRKEDDLTRVENGGGADN